MLEETPSRSGTSRSPQRRKPRGRLKIGDEWMAIQIIARSQTNPQKAVAELVENSIDAGATRITITRGRRRGKIFLRVSDDGRGVPLGAEGVPDFDYVATHVCDSLKRRLDERQRGGVQGEFGIGLLGFWSIGRELEMVSQAGDAPPHLMTMRSGSRTYDRRRYLGARGGHGVDVTIHDVHRGVQSRLTAEKLQRYLAEELRERIRRQSVAIVIEDRLPPRKTLEVRPAVFRGERITEIADIPLENHPPVRAEIYLASDASAGAARQGGASGSAGARGAPGPESAPDAARPAVALYRLGTRVCHEIALLPEFAREPWTSGRLEGALDYADFHLSPASREGFAPDAAYLAFVDAVRGIEPILLERIRREDETRAERAGRSLVRELQSAFARILRDLPAGDYEWFGADGRRPFAGGGSGRPGRANATPGGGAEPDSSEGAAVHDGRVDGELGDVGGPDSDSRDGGPDAGSDDAPNPQPALITGPLERLVLKPAVVRVVTGRRRRVAAVALDASNLIIERGLGHVWTLSPGAGSLSVEPGGRAIVEAGNRPARALLTVRVTHDPADKAPGEAPREMAAEAEVVVEADAARRAFPPPVFVHAVGETWRSRWNAVTGKLEVNSAHADFQAARQSQTRRRRYLGRLYAKELVLHNFGHEPTSAALERLVEVLARLDEHL
jgi:Histidine kinase-, DNA gyrase B-, and HSP90-like ATPase